MSDQLRGLKIVSYNFSGDLVFVSCAFSGIKPRKL